MAAERFGPMLRAHRIKVGLSQNALARLASVDPAYVNRMERRDDRTVPRRGILLSLAEALRLGESEADRLLFAAGLAPATDYQTLAEELHRRLAAVQGALEGFGALEANTPLPFVRRTG